MTEPPEGNSPLAEEPTRSAPLGSADPGSPTAGNDPGWDLPTAAAPTADTMVGDSPVARELLSTAIEAGPLHQGGVAGRVLGVWEVVREQGKHAETESLEKQTKLVRETEIALNLEHKADLRCALGQSEPAEPLLNRVLKIRENALGLRHEDVARTLTRLAKLHREQGRHADAKRLEARAREIHAELSTY